MRPSYHIARQEHLGDQLDELRAMNLLTWRWDYKDRRAIWWIAEGVGPKRRFDTKAAEAVVQRLCDEQQIAWLPVPHPGGEDQRRETNARIAARKHEAAR